MLLFLGLVCLQSGSEQGLLTGGKTFVGTSLLFGMTCGLLLKYHVLGLSKGLCLRVELVAVDKDRKINSILLVM